MTTYIQRNATSDLSPFGLFNKTLIKTVGANQTFNITLTGSQTISGGWITNAGDPNSDIWDTENNQAGVRVEMDLSVTNMNITARVRFVRLSSTGTVLQNGAFTATQTLNADRVFAPVVPLWTKTQESCGNRLAIEYEFTNTVASSQSATFNINTATSEAVLTLTSDIGSCANETFIIS